MVAAAWEEWPQGLGRSPEPDAAPSRPSITAGVAVLEGHGFQPPAAPAVSEGEALWGGARSGTRSPTRGRGALRQLLDGVEAEHVRQLRALREQLGQVREQLAQALHGAGRGRPADDAAIAPRAPDSAEAAPAEAPAALPGVPGLPLGCPPMMGQGGEGGPRSAAWETPSPMPQGRRQSLEVPGNNGGKGLHEAPTIKVSEDAEETRRPSNAPSNDASASSSRNSRENAVKEQIVWQTRRDTDEMIVHSIYMRVLVALGVYRHSPGQHNLPGQRDQMNVVGVFMNSTLVNHVCCWVIILNAMCIGASAHFTLRAEINEESVSNTWESFEIGFTAWFTAEILLRIIGERRLFYLGDDRGWNLLDLFLVVSSLTTLLAAASVPSLTAMRMLRIFRLIRIFRAVRVVRSIQNFRIMILAIIQSFGTLMWVFVVIVSFQFVFAVLFMHGAADYLREEGLFSADARAIKDLFGDIFTALLTLFESITGGRDWHEVLVALLDMHWTYGSLFLVYIFFMTFLVLNVVVGGVVKTTSEVYKRDKSLIVQEEQQKVHLYSDEVKSFFRDADQDGSGTLSWEEFCKYLNDDKVKAYFQSLDLEISQAHMLFTLLDTDGDDEVGIDEFIDGCMTLKGHARTIDVKFLAQQVQIGLEEMTRRVNDKFDRLAGGEPASRRNSRVNVRRNSVSQPPAQRSEST